MTVVVLGSRVGNLRRLATIMLMLCEPVHLTLPVLEMLPLIAMTNRVLLLTNCRHLLRPGLQLLAKWPGTKNLIRVFILLRALHTMVASATLLVLQLLQTMTPLLPVMVVRTWLIVPRTLRSLKGLCSLVSRGLKHRPVPLIELTLCRTNNRVNSGDNRYRRRSLPVSRRPPPRENLYVQCVLTTLLPSKTQ